jgi:hypothetical protein
VQHRGRWIDPASLREQPQPPIPGAEMASFVERRDLLREGLAAGAFGDRARESERTEVAARAAPVAGGR